MTHNYSKTFFSKKRAESFQAELKAQGIKADIWTGADYLNRGETLYYVKWNFDLSANGIAARMGGISV